MTSMNTNQKKSNNDAVIDHENWPNYPYTEVFKFSANGRSVYICREFENGQLLYWKHDTESYPLDDGEPISRRSYAAVK